MLVNKQIKDKEAWEQTSTYVAVDVPDIEGYLCQTYLIQKRAFYFRYGMTLAIIKFKTSNIWRLGVLLYGAKLRLRSPIYDTGSRCWYIHACYPWICASVTWALQCLDF